MPGDSSVSCAGVYNSRGLNQFRKVSSLGGAISETGGLGYGRRSAGGIRRLSRRSDWPRRAQASNIRSEAQFLQAQRIQLAGWRQTVRFLKAPQGSLCICVPPAAGIAGIISAAFERRLNFIRAVRRGRLRKRHMMAPHPTIAVVRCRCLRVAAQTGIVQACLADITFSCGIRRRMFRDSLMRRGGFGVARCTGSRWRAAKNEREQSNSCDAMHRPRSRSSPRCCHCRRSVAFFTGPAAEFFRHGTSCKSDPCRRHRSL